MTYFTSPKIIQTIQGTEIWYCESTDNHMYIGIVINDKSRHMFVRAIEKDKEAAIQEFLKLGQVVMVMSMAELISDFSFDQEEQTESDLL